MAKNAIYTVKYRRKREGRTNYKKRLELLKSGSPRLVIRKSNTSITLQLVMYESDGDKVLITYTSKKFRIFRLELFKEVYSCILLSWSRFCKTCSREKGY